MLRLQEELRDSEVLQIRVKKQLLVNLAFFFSFFPFIRVVPWIDASVQPISALLAFVIILLFGVKKDRVCVTVLLLVVAVLGYLMIGMARGVSIVQAVYLTVGYLMPLWLFLALRDNSRLLSVKVYLAAVGIYLIVGALQYFELLVWSEPHLGPVFPNISSPPKEPRGVNFVATEPAHAGTIIVLMLVTGLYFYQTGQLSRRGINWIAVAVAIMFFLNRSGTVLVLLSLFVLAYACMSAMYRPVLVNARLLAIILAVVIALWGGIDTLIETYRGSAKYVWMLGVLNETPWDELWQYESVGLLAGKRFLTVVVGYLSLSDQMGIGHGIGSYHVDFMRLSEAIGIYWLDFNFLADGERYAESFKPDSYGSSLALDTGIIGLAILLILLACIWRDRGSKTLGEQSLESRTVGPLRGAILVVAVFMILIYTTTTLPVPWVLLAYVCSLCRVPNLKCRPSHMALAKA
jgi:hypothetical protein